MAFEELKERQRVMWGSGPFERIEAIIADMHERVVQRLRPQPGERWLDVGCGTGGVAALAARAGADVTGIDLAPALVETARGRAAADGIPCRYEVGDAEQLPYEDASFDVVASTVGAMFAPDQGAVASEFARVLRPGGRLAFTAWRPEGGGGDLFRLLAPFQPPPPEGVPSPLEWGREEHVRALLGDAFALEIEEHDSPYTPASGEEAWELFATAFGPLRTLVDALPPERVDELRRVFVAYHEEQRGDDGAIRVSRRYLLVLGTRR